MRHHIKLEVIGGWKYEEKGKGIQNIHQDLGYVEKVFRSTDSSDFRDKSYRAHEERLAGCPFFVAKHQISHRP